ncbi:MAG: NADH-quinone oxidoreductase subunit C [Dehalococcoidales bacterium]|nr:NADH-quinone oxidoreductase subunit C [Dehalococcoidales bacterium]
MTTALSAKEIVSKLSAEFPDAVKEAGADSVLVKSASLPAVTEYLKTADGLKFDYINYITAIDYYDYFEVVYMMTSTEYNRSVTLKTRCETRNRPTVPSLAGIYQGADWQEREVYDLMGITFKGHPNMKRVFLWEGFDGHPLRKDWNK